MRQFEICVYSTVSSSEIIYKEALKTFCPLYISVSKLTWFTIVYEQILIDIYKRTVYNFFITFFHIRQLLSIKGWDIMTLKTVGHMGYFFLYAGVEIFFFSPPFTLVIFLISFLTDWKRRDNTWYYFTWPKNNFV